MRHCPICWSERKIRHGIAEIRYWWKYSVLKKQKPDAVDIVKELIPPLINLYVGLKVMDEVVRAMDNMKDYEKRHKKEEVKKNDGD